MKHSGLCCASVLTGLLIGSAVTMLLTPKTGQQVRDAIREFLEKETDKIRCDCNE